MKNMENKNKMTDDDKKQMVTDILNYFFSIEFLNQKNLEKQEKIRKESATYIDNIKNKLLKKRKNALSNFIYVTENDNLYDIVEKRKRETDLPFCEEVTVYLGRMSKKECIERIFEHKEIDWEKVRNKDEEIVIATIRFKTNGDFVDNSLFISPIVWSVFAATNNNYYNEINDMSKRLSPSLYREHIVRIQKGIKDKLPVFPEDLSPSDRLKQINFELLNDIKNEINRLLKIGEKQWKDELLKNKMDVYFNLYEDSSIKRLDDPVSYLEFYSEDIAAIADEIRNDTISKEKIKVLSDYLLGIYYEKEYPNELPDRLDILHNPDDQQLFSFFSTTLAIDNAPLGKWPSRFMPALMQQVAINLAISNDHPLPVFSVNGPPGTGKTTLLKEIIVNNIIEKANLLAEYDDPDDAFEKCGFSHGDKYKNSYDQDINCYYRLKNKMINDYGILVASSNNTAVENITKELPLEEDIINSTKPQRVDNPNNAALDNVSKLFTVAECNKKLPVYTDNRVEDEWKPDVYFSQIATLLLNSDMKKKNSRLKQAFGLISAAFGKRNNIDNVLNNVLIPLKQILREVQNDFEFCKNDYRTAQKIFKDKYDLVKDLQIRENGSKMISDLQKEIAEQEKALKTVLQRTVELKSEINQKKKEFKEAKAESHEKLDELNLKIRESEHVILVLQKKNKEKRRTQRSHEAHIEDLKQKARQSNHIPRCQRIFQPNIVKENEKRLEENRSEQKMLLDQISDLTVEIQEAKEKIQIERNDIKKRKNDISMINSYLNDIEVEIQQNTDAVNNYNEQCKSLKNSIKKIQKQLSTKLELHNHKKDPYDKSDPLDENFMNSFLSSDPDISTNAQIKNPWFSDHYNREREKLFAYALDLIKNFILASKKYKTNLSHMICLWSGSYHDGEKVTFQSTDLSDITEAAFESLFLLIPVLSSTFASIHNLFKNMNKENCIGMLIIDEAGQAVPHAAIGALYRAKKAVIVGDPRQIEPVVTEEQDIIKSAYAEDPYTLYKDKEISVQSFADMMNPYGTYLNSDKKEHEWVGCPLIVHRRCISPMYDISNGISYNNIMKNQTAEPKPEELKLFIMDRTQWIDVQGKQVSKSNHYVKEQGAVAIRMIETSLAKRNGKEPDLFVISPFNSVTNGLSAQITEYINSNPSGILARSKDLIMGWKKTHIGTIHTFQGKQAAEVIFLLGCDDTQQSKGARRWVSSNIVNVAVTRAKYRLYIIGDAKAWGESKYTARAKKLIDRYNNQ